MATNVKGFSSPLPSNYEARWDPNQKAYFFINHNDKSTSWQDPRLSSAQPREPSHSQHAQGHAQTSTPHRQADYHGYTHAGQASPRAAAQLLNTNLHRQHQGASSGQSGEAVRLDTFITQYGSKTVAGDYAADEDSDSVEEDFDNLFQSASQSQDSTHVDEANLRTVKQMFPNVPDKFLLNTLTRNRNVLSLTVSEITAAGYTKLEVQEEDSELEARHNTAVQRLRGVFPMVRWDIIQDVLAGCNYNEESAKVQLIAFGYHPKTHDSSRPSPSPKPVRQEQRYTAVAQAPELSSSDKARLKNQMKCDFPTLEASVIDMALVSSKYDVDKARQVLQSWTASKSSSRTRVSATTSGSTSTGSLPPIMKLQGELEPVIFGKDDHPNSKPSSRATTPSGSVHSTPSHSVKTTPQRSVPTATRDESTHGTTHAHAHHRTDGTSHKHHGTTHEHHGTTHTHHRKAKQVTQMSEQLVTSTNDVLNHITSACCLKPSHDSDQNEESPRKQVVITQPQDYVSSYHSKPIGPDQSLRQGPNKDLLLDDYVANKGPNPNLHLGPDPQRVLGSRGSQGPDPHLHCGPQSGQHQDLASPRRILVGH